MSVRELKRHEVLGRVSRNEIGLGDAAALMEVSYRQAKRIWKRYRQEGVPGPGASQRWTAFEPEQAQGVARTRDSADSRTV